MVAIELRQEQKLKQTLSQNMIQSAEILQMGQLELNEYLENMALENPVVDLDEVHPDKDNNNEEFIRKLEELQSADAQNRQYYQQDEDEAGRFEPAGSTDLNLEESLLEQLLYMKVTKEEFGHLKYMIMNLDDNGYLTYDLSFMCGELGISEQEGERLLAILQKMEPRGVGARDLKECLILQLREQDENPVKGLAEQIISDYLEELGRNRLDAIAKKLHCKLEKVAAAREMIKKLNPRPGSGFAGGKGSGKYQKYLVPDVLVIRKEDHFEIVINDETYPQIAINPYYLSLMKKDQSGEAAGYIKNKVRQAEWACRCVEQRNKTLYLLVREILKAQTAFFEGGKGRLVPLTQRSVAEILGLNESTISRAAREKYLQCQWGIFPIQFFFSRGGSEAQGSPVSAEAESGFGGSLGAGGASSAEAVKEKIRLLIEAEDKKKPCSDRILAEKLAESGISVSRRTVAKYREAIGIADASGRKAFL